MKRRASKVREHRITPTAIEAFIAGDYFELHRALGLRPWEASPLPLSVDALGVDADRGPPSWMTEAARLADWEQAAELQRKLREAASCR